MTEPPAPASGLHLANATPVMDLMHRIAEKGGRGVIVGGWVRDRLCGEASKDFDLEIFGLSSDAISRLLQPLGFSPPVGQHFPVWRQTGHGIDVSLPRAGAETFSSDIDGSLAAAFREASLYRDLTINAMGWDPLPNSGDDPEARGLLDPWKGRADLEERRLRAVDLDEFGSDPLRVLRVARLRARYDAEVDSGLRERCREIDLGALPPERVATELKRILCELPRPSMAFDFLSQVGQLEVFPPVAALRNVPQDPKWHPEGDVYIHTMQVVDCAVKISSGLPAEVKERLVFAALCHDLGKPETTKLEDGVLRSIGHEKVGADRTREWLEDLRMSGRSVQAVEALVAHHLAPGQFISQGAGAKAYRKLARKLAPSEVTLVELERLARADHLGRVTPGADPRRFDAGEAFLAAAESAEVKEGARPDVVRASQLMARGIDPGPELGRLLARCRVLQDESGETKAEVLVARVLGDRE